MTITVRDLNRATLARQLLLDREPLSVSEAVARVVAIQAQEPASPYLALWNRIADFDPAALDAAFAERSVVRSSLFRLTLHAVRAEDHPSFHQAMLPSLRASRLKDRRFMETGLTADDLDGLLPTLRDLLTEPRPQAEIEAFLEDQLGRHEPRAWWALRMYGPVNHAPTGGAWSFERGRSFVAAPDQDAPSHGKAVRYLIVRYLEGFGPASLRDIAQFTMLRMKVLREALAALGEDLVELDGPDGTTLLDVPTAPRPPGDTPAPARLLPMWDSILLAYDDRSRIIPPDLRPTVIRRNGDVLPTVLIDGFVAGVWRPVEAGIEVTAFHPVTEAAWTQLEVEARALVIFLEEREPTVYQRYTRWWSSLPRGETRILPT